MVFVVEEFFDEFDVVEVYEMCIFFYLVVQWKLNFLGFGEGLWIFDCCFVVDVVWVYYCLMFGDDYLVVVVVVGVVELCGVVLVCDFDGEGVVVLGVV